MQLSKRQKIILGVSVLVVIIILIVGIKTMVRPQPTITLRMWGTEENKDVWDSIISAYRKTHPNIEIRYEYENSANYDRDLINAYGNNTSPDIFMVSNTKLPQYSDKIAPWVSDNEFGIKQIQENYPQVVLDDLTSKDSVYGLPLYIDTLGLYFNRSIFDYNNIALPPNTWEDLLRLSSKFRKIDTHDRISRAGIALGLAQNVNWYTDILSIMMMQKGAIMVSSDHNEARLNWSSNANSKILPGSEALKFYAQFSQTSKSAYTWNSTFPNSLDAFSTGKAAMYIGYSGDRFKIKEKSSDLNFGVAKLPYFANGENNYTLAYYNNLVVSKQSKQAAEAWDFIIFATSQNQAKYYFEQTHNPPARRDLIDYYKNDSDIGVFIGQTLSARSWYQNNPDLVKNIFMVMIEDVIYNGISTGEATQTASDRITNVLNKK